MINAFEGIPGASRIFGDEQPEAVGAPPTQTEEQPDAVGTPPTQVDEQQDDVGAPPTQAEEQPNAVEVSESQTSRGSSGVGEDASGVDRAPTHAEEHPDAMEVTESQTPRGSSEAGAGASGVEGEHQVRELTGAIPVDVFFSVDRCTRDNLMWNRFAVSSLVRIASASAIVFTSLATAPIHETGQ